eukprot:scaffold122311_cov63-Phaeocystis_antarctica.AAC.6
MQSRVTEVLTVTLVVHKSQQHFMMLGAHYSTPKMLRTFLLLLSAASAAPSTFTSPPRDCAASPCVDYWHDSEGLLPARLATAAIPPT